MAKKLGVIVAVVVGRVGNLKGAVVDVDEPRKLNNGIAVVVAAFAAPDESLAAAPAFFKAKAPASKFEPGIHNWYVVKYKKC